MPESARPAALDFKCGPRGVLSHGRRAVSVGPNVYALAVYLKHKRCVLLATLKARLWGERTRTPDNTVSKLGQRLNEKLLELGATARVSISEGRVELK